MIKSFTVINYLGESINIKLTDSEPDHGLLVKSMKGLGPAKANINTTDLATADGSKYNSARLDDRNIVIEFYFMATPTIEDTRQRTYKYFPIKKPLTLVIETDNRVVMTTGYVESNEPNIWSQNESNQISIVCPDPYFYSVFSNKTKLYSVKAEFEFPFENEAGTESIELGAYLINEEYDIWYDGDAETGIDIYIKYTHDDVGDLTIFNTGTREQIIIKNEIIAQIVGSAPKKGDEIYISTVRGNKSIILVRNRTEYNIFNSIGRDADWFTLSKGDNYFAYTATSGTQYLLVEIDNKIVYEGV